MEKAIYSQQYALIRGLLKKVRVDAGISQEAMAEKLQIGQSMISKIERGERRLDILELRAWCTATGVSLERFVVKLEATLKQKSGRKE